MPSDNDLEKIYFEPSTLETIDQSVYDFVEGLSLHTTTNKGFVRVPVLWGTSERSFLTKDKKEVRDVQGALIFPLISVRRVSLNKPLSSPGAFQGTVPENADAHYKMGLALQGRERKGEALRAFETALKLFEEQDNFEGKEKVESMMVELEN